MHVIPGISYSEFVQHRWKQIASSKIDEYWEEAGVDFRKLRGNVTLLSFCWAAKQQKPQRLPTGKKWPCTPAERTSNLLQNFDFLILQFVCWPLPLKSDLVHRQRGIPDICHGWYPWRKICHVEKFYHMTDFHVDKFSTSQIVMWTNSLHDRLSCRKNSAKKKWLISGMQRGRENCEEHPLTQLLVRVLLACFQARRGTCQSSTQLSVLELIWVLEFICEVSSVLL